MKHRITVRGMAAATAVVAVSTGPPLGATALADHGEPTTAPLAVARPLPVAGDPSPKPPAAVLAQVARKQQREAARKQAARKAREARAARANEKRASRSASRTQTFNGDARGIAAAMAAETYGWGADQFSCLDSLWEGESGWSHTAANPSSGAYGIPQALPGSKMGAYGADWRTNPVTQIQWGLAYVDATYGSPCSAWSAFQSKGWY